MKMGQDSGKKPWHSLKIHAYPMSEGQGLILHIATSPQLLNKYVFGLER